jgi:hypothetical protein
MCDLEDLSAVTDPYLPSPDSKMSSREEGSTRKKRKRHKTTVGIVDVEENEAGVEEQESSAMHFEPEVENKQHGLEDGTLPNALPNVSPSAGTLPDASPDVSTTAGISEDPDHEVEDEVEVFEDEKFYTALDTLLDFVATPNAAVEPVTGPEPPGAEQKSPVLVDICSSDSGTEPAKIDDGAHFKKKKKKKRRSNGSKGKGDEKHGEKRVLEKQGVPEGRPQMKATDEELDKNKKRLALQEHLASLHAQLQEKRRYPT